MAGRDTFRTNSLEQQSKVDLAKALAIPPPAAVYGYLKQSNRFKITYELQTTIPVSNSNPDLRAYSPFTMEVVPPLIFAGDPVLENGTTPTKVGLIEAAQKAYDPFNNAKDRKRYEQFRQMSFIGDKQRETFEKLVISGKYYRKNSGDQSKYAGQGDVYSDPVIADVLTAADIGLQINNLLRTPPLVWLVNPNSMNVSHTKIQQYTERTRYGYVFQAHGEEQPKLSISGVIGAFMAGSATPLDTERTFIRSQRGFNSSVTGLQFASKRDSAAFQNLMNISSLYMNSGYIFDTLGKSMANHFVGALAIRYDGWVYVGHIESFSYSYEDTKQNGGLGFDIEFTASQIFDTTSPVTVVRPLNAPTSSPSDPKYGALGTLPTLVSRNVIMREINQARTDLDVANTLPRENPSSAAATSLPPNRRGFRTPQTTSTPTLNPSAQPFGV